MTTLLNVRVHAFNRLHTEANRIEREIIKALAPFVGTQVKKQSGGLLEKVNSALPAMDYSTAGTQRWVDASNYTLRFGVRVCELLNNPAGGCLYAETHITVGELDGVILAKTLEPQTRRTDYTAEEIHALRAQFSDATQRARELETKLYPFGQFDR